MRGDPKIKSEKRRRLTKLFNILLEEWLITSTQEQLAKNIGVTSGFIDHVKRGDEWFGLERVELICQALGIPDTYFELADEELTIDKNKKMVKLLMELRENFVAAALAKK